ncbi:Prion -(Q/N-rich)-domain-bearing protein [Trichostrongylus colubriformis]|uniref:Prion -(Q/N-rich)-domain-bearing protein n=1 Tax=Trichostrongylus colubriformis TaxID=6319 RepID=A0AAN8FNX8_TRICO
MSLETSRPSYGPDEDYEEDALPPQMTTTPSVQTQIPTPTAFDPLWPTPAPGHFYQGDPRNPKKTEQRFTNYGDEASENNIPCSAYTDDICYQQQEKLGREGLSKCCKSGIYLTDVCMPGKCSNHTMQLCCFQKFLQARYRCCEDDEQSLGPASTMDFSMCCYRNFVTEDDCCNAETASRYWRSVHEVRFAEGVRVVNLNENRIWDYECRNGVNRTQYAFLP